MTSPWVEMKDGNRAQSSGTPLEFYLSDISNSRGIQASPGRCLTSAQNGESSRLSKLQLEMIQAHLALVIARAKHFFSKNRFESTLEDLILAGNEGLVEAALRFDIGRGVSFATFATWWIDNKIRSAIREELWPMRIPESTYKDVLKIRRIMGDLELSLARSPSRDDIIHESGWPSTKVDRALSWARRTDLSLDSPIGERGQNTVGDFITEDDDLMRAGKIESPTEKAMANEFSEKLGDALASLTNREREVVLLRYGIAAHTSGSIGGRLRSFLLIGRELGMSAERARQIHHKALRKLRHPSRSRLLTAFY